MQLAYKQLYLIMVCDSIQIKQFQDKNEETLTSVKRVVSQIVQNTEANIAWIDNYYEEISNWLLRKIDGE